MKPNPDSMLCPRRRNFLRTGSVFLLACALAAPLHRAFSAATDESITATVETWLALLDQGDYAKSWDEAGAAFQKAVTKDGWVSAAKGVRQPLGKLVSRKVKSTSQTNKLPGMPPGSYLVAVFDTSFAVMKLAAETAVFALEKNGEWKAAGYFVAPRAAEPKAASTACPVAGDEAVTSALKTIRQKTGVPAMSAAVVTSAGIQYVGAVGVRKRGTEIPVTLEDKWHLGSDGKAMTSALVARLVERGQLKWETTLAEAFPDLASQMHADFKSVTLLHLLSHRAGLPANLDLAQYRGNDATALRLRAVREQLVKQPTNPRGKMYLYSNLGYIIAAAVVEKTIGQPWERILVSELFEPLKMNSVGFGGMGTPGQVDQPWPHTGDGRPVAGNGPVLDNPPVMSPAGRVHCSIQDWAKFIQDQLRGARGEAALLKPDSYNKMHTPPFGGDYALGWNVVDRPWGGGRVFNHTGDNTMNFANVWVAPKRDFAILVCVNQSGKAAFDASDEAIGALMPLAEKKKPVK